MDPHKGMLAYRTAALVCFVAILAWLSVVIGVGAVNLTGRPWCAAGTACATTFWPRLGVSAAGGVTGFILVGYGLLNLWQRRGLLVASLAGLALTIGTGVWFLPVLGG